VTQAFRVPQAVEAQPRRRPAQRHRGPNPPRPNAGHCAKRSPPASRRVLRIQAAHSEPARRRINFRAGSSLSHNRTRGSASPSRSRGPRRKSSRRGEASTSSNPKTPSPCHTCRSCFGESMSSDRLRRCKQPQFSPDQSGPNPSVAGELRSHKGLSPWRCRPLLV